MGNVKVVMDSKVIEDILSSAPIQNDLMTRANRIKAAADSMGSGTYEVNQRRGRKGGRPYWVVSVPEGDWETYYSNQKHNTLQKSKNAGR